MYPYGTNPYKSFASDSYWGICFYFNKVPTCFRLDVFRWFLTGSSDIPTRSGRLIRPFCANALKFGKQIKERFRVSTGVSETTTSLLQYKSDIFVKITYHTHSENTAYISLTLKTKTCTYLTKI